MPTAGGNYYWNNGSNWTGGVPNSSTTEAYLSPTSALTGNQLIYQQGQACSSLVVGDPGGVYTQTLTNSGAANISIGSAGTTALVEVNGQLASTVNSLKASTIYDPVNVNGGSLEVLSNSVPVGNTTTPNFQALFLGDGFYNAVNFTINHAYVLLGSTASGVANYTGATTLQGGYATLDLGFASASGINLPATTALTLADTTDTLEMGGDYQTVGSLSGTGVVSLDFFSSLTTATNGTTFAGRLSGNGTYHVGGSGTTMTLTGNSAAGTTAYPAFTGTVLVSPTGTGFLFNDNLSVNSDAALGATAATLSLSTGTLATTASFTLTHPVTTAGGPDTLAPAASTTLTVTGQVTGNGLRTGGGGTVALANGSNSFSTLTVGSGTAQFSADGNLGASGGEIFMGGGNLELLANNTVTTSRPVQLATTGSIAVDQNSTLTLNGVLSEAAGSVEFPNHAILTAFGPGTLVLGGSNTYTGGTVINGTVSISNDANLGRRAPPSRSAARWTRWGRSS